LLCGGDIPRTKALDGLPHLTLTAVDNFDSSGQEHLLGIGAAPAGKNVSDASAGDPLGRLDPGAAAQIFAGVFDYLEFESAGVDD
jgi:hypothetical protein